jgi:hypothetical protein
MKSFNKLVALYSKSHAAGKLPKAAEQPCAAKNLTLGEVEP